MTRRTIFGLPLAALGLVLVLGEVGLYWYARVAVHEHYDINPWVVMIGGTLAFLGGFLIDNKKAEEAAGFVVNSGVAILAVVRGTGRRTGDATVVTATPTPPAKPAPDAMPGEGKPS